MQRNGAPQRARLPRLQRSRIPSDLWQIIALQSPSGATNRLADTTEAGAEKSAESGPRGPHSQADFPLTVGGFHSLPPYQISVSHDGPIDSLNLYRSRAGRRPAHHHGGRGMSKRGSSRGAKGSLQDPNESLQLPHIGGRGRHRAQDITKCRGNQP